MPTSIEWVVLPNGLPDSNSQGETLNPTTGCTEKSEGCRLCYAQYTAASLVRRFQQPKYVEVVNPETSQWNGEIRFFPAVLEIPRKRKKPCTYFVGDMSDIFHHNVESAWLEQIFEMFYDCRQRHIFLVLTKRPEIMLEWISHRMWLLNDPMKHVWLGTTVENQRRADERMPLISQLSEVGYNTYLSVEPMLSAINLQLDKYPVRWAIFGGESNPPGVKDKARPCHIKWLESGVEQCLQAGVAPFVKQLGSFPVTDQWSDYCIPLTDGEKPQLKQVSPPALYRYQTAGNQKGGGKHMSLWSPILQIREIPYLVNTKN